MPKKPLLLSTPQYRKFTEKVADQIGGEICEVERKLFPDGERYQRLVNDVHER